MKFKLIFVFLFLIQQTVSAQNPLVLKGKIYDSATNEPLQYATISIPHTTTGVISNEFGEFAYHIPDSIKRGFVEISFIGYERTHVAIDTIDADKIYVFRLRPKTLELGEINVVGENLISARRIVRRAIRNIAKNYPKETFQLYGYYRDYIRDLNTSDYNNLTEAAVIIEDKGFNTNDYKRTKIKIEQIRYNPLIASDTSLNIGYDGTVKYVPNADITGSNDLAILLFHNPIRNHKIKTFSFVEELDADFVANHEFNFQSIIKSDSSEIYEIKFHSDTILGMMDNTKYLGEGTFHVNADDLAILKFNYNLFCDTPSFSGKLFEIQLEYKKYSGQYYLSYLSMDNYFEFTYKRFGMYRPKTEQLYQYRELFINKIVTDIVEPISKEEAIQKNKMLMSNKIPEIPGFWNDYNAVINERLTEE